MIFGYNLLIFLFFESVFGICLGWKVYALFNKGKAQYCPGEICERRSRQDIQKTSAYQLLVVLLFVIVVSLLSTFFNGYYSRKPYDLFGLFTTIKEHVHARQDDILIFCGSGMTAAVGKLQRIMGLPVAGAGDGSYRLPRLR